MDICHGIPVVHVDIHCMRHQEHMITKERDDNKWRCKMLVILQLEIHNPPLSTSDLIPLYKYITPHAL